MNKTFNKSHIKQIGLKVQATSDNWLKKWKASWKNEEDLRDCMKGVFADACDIHTVGRLIERGDIAAAYKLANSLDTIVRDEIPGSAWRCMEDYLGIDTY